jgi:hypothetical protein
VGGKAMGSSKAPPRRSQGGASKMRAKKPEKQPPSRVRDIIGAWSTTKKILAGIVAICAGVSTIGGAVKLGVEGYDWYQARQEEPSAFSRTPNLGLQFWQNGKQIPMADEALSDAERQVVVTMRPDPFELWFPSLKNDAALQVCAWHDDSIFTLDSELSMDSTRCFAAGTGMATAAYADGSLVQAVDGHNYYAGERVEAAGVDGYSKIYVSRTGSAYGEMDPLSGAAVEDLYVVAVIDRDQDRVLDPGEYEYLALSFG